MVGSTSLSEAVGADSMHELLKLYHLTSVHSYKSVIAQVVGEAPSNFQNTVEITVGTDGEMLALHESLDAKI